MKKSRSIIFTAAQPSCPLGSWGCNFTCPFCQNWQISQQPASSRDLTPEEVVALAEKYVPQGNIGLAYTYNEPTLSYEFIL